MATQKSIFFTLARMAARIAFRSVPIAGEIATAIDIIEDLSEIKNASEDDPQVQRIKKFIRGWDRITRERRQQQ